MFLVGIYYEYYCIIGSEFFFGKIFPDFFYWHPKIKCHFFISACPGMAIFYFSDMSIFIYEMIIILVIKIVMNAVTIS